MVTPRWRLTEGGKEESNEDAPVDGDGHPLHALDVGAEAANQGFEFTGRGVPHCVRDIQGSSALGEGGGGEERRSIVGVQAHIRVAMFRHALGGPTRPYVARTGGLVFVIMSHRMGCRKACSWGERTAAQSATGSFFGLCPIRILS